MGQKLVRLWDRDFNCLWSGYVDDIGEVFEGLTVTADPVDEAGLASGGWQARTACRVGSVELVDVRAGASKFLSAP